MESCPGYKVLQKYGNPIGAKDHCCELTTHDNECGKSFFLNPVIGKCVCEKKGHDCIRTIGFHTEFRFGDESGNFVILLLIQVNTQFRARVLSSAKIIY